MHLVYMYMHICTIGVSMAVWKKISGRRFGEAAVVKELPFFEVLRFEVQLIRNPLVRPNNKSLQSMRPTDPNEDLCNTLINLYFCNFFT